MAIVAVSISPVGVGVSVSKYVAAAVTFCLAVGGFFKLAHEVADGDHVAFENRIMHSLRREGAPLGGGDVVATLG